MTGVVFRDYLYHRLYIRVYKVGCLGDVQLGWGLSTGRLLVGPAKVKTRESIFFTEASPEVRIKMFC